jgi:hypothetical protein
MIFGRGVPISKNGAFFEGIYPNWGMLQGVFKSEGGSGGSLWARYVWRKIEKYTYIETPPQTPGTPLSPSKNSGNPTKQLNGAHNDLEFPKIGTPLYFPLEISIHALLQNPTNFTKSTPAANLNHESEIIGGF